MKSTALLTLLFGSGLSSIEIPFKTLSKESLTLMIQEIVAKRASSVSHNPSLKIVELEQESTIYLITQPGHFAHPSILKRSIKKLEHENCVEVAGFTVCDPDTMEVWMTQFREQDSVIRSTFVKD
ncbi:hypothetical protein AAKU64_000848 [Undibacterium sp. GrIS 1.8]|uniref:hypothetical protein n=1 Tax=Undibacterium sp. GrIS 1.8 TaxID=3143934 RepID=UPI00339B6B0D